jgi:hypothetical protein
MQTKSLAAAICLAIGIALLSFHAQAGSDSIKVYKSPTCGCCSKWIDHLRANGFEVEAVEIKSVQPVKISNGVTPELASCHTALVGGYVVEGHVPASDVRRLLEERPKISGLAVPKMPIGSPGMEGPNPERYDVIAFGGKGGPTVFATHGP